MTRSNHAFSSSNTILHDQTTPSPARSQYCKTKPRLRQLEHNIARRNDAFASSNTILHDQTTPSPARSQYCTIKPRLRQLDHNIARRNDAFASSNTILHDQTTPSPVNRALWIASAMISFIFDCLLYFLCFKEISQNRILALLFVHGEW
jgi:hypothetical protein